MLDFTNCNIGSVIAHQVGNQTNDEKLILSATLINTEDSRLRELLIKYLLHPFKDLEEFYSFTFSDGDFELNPVYKYSKSIFLNNNNLIEKSESIAKLLYEIALHPQIKSGDLFVATFNNIKINDGKMVNALGIFKSENLQEFLKLTKKSKEFTLKYDDGININKLDKGCLIFNIEKENGFKVCVIDSNKSTEAQYWKDTFLQLKPIANEFHQTNQFLGIAKNFITKQLPEEFEVNKTDQIDILNRSVEYFKTHENFDKKEFEKEVLQDTGLVKSFQKFDDNYRQENNIELSDNFEISQQAVKKQSRAFKSVLKLDKNFHIYIHGDRELIEQGVDKDGRKFYKIYFENEA